MGASSNKVVVDVELRAQLDQMRSGVKELEGLFKNLKLSPSKNTEMTQLFTDMKKDLQEIESLTENGKISGKDFSTLQKKMESISSISNKLGKELAKIGGLSAKELQKLIPDSAFNGINQATTAIDKFEQEIHKVVSASQEFKDLEQNMKENQDSIDQANEALKRYEQMIEKINGNQSISDKQLQNSGVETLAMQYNKALSEIQSTQKQIGMTISDKVQELQQEREKIQQIIDSGQATEADKEQSNAIEQEINKLTGMIDAENIARNNLLQGIEQHQNEATATVQQAEQAIDSLRTKMDQLDANQASQAFDQLKTELSQIEGLDINWDEITNLDELKTKIGTLGNEIGNNLLNQIINVSSGFANNLKPAISSANSEVDRARQNLEQMGSSMKQVEQLAQRGLYFFGLTNAVNLLKRAVRSAIDTVQELDKAMTETAVVTDFSVGDMWEKLPDYTKTANEYNATLKDTYEVMTLYYQQGLQTNQVFAVGEQTMKMARIAGLDYEVATDRMTNALRGFNMEINTMNAEHVADVYSKLAAISASNVKELSVAMTKTASLANSANMSFDNTAAFLAKIIETTRESAETAGTALKTVIARFSEVKKLYNEGDLIGDVEGEEVNINKVGEALRAAGVDLNEFMTGAKGLDEIFIELAGKWDQLDLLTQRYIATMAAGSRQQSRFLALMSDNQRLVELMNGAYNATGASTEQFEKTQESLQSKLNNLKNAWDAFLMGIANDKLVKGVVDALTVLVTVINKVLEAVEKIGSVFGSFGGDIAKSIASIGLMWGALKLGRVIITQVANSVFGVIGNFNEMGKAAKNTGGLISNLAVKIANFRQGKGFVINPDLDDTQVMSKWKQMKMALSSDPIEVTTVTENATKTATKEAEAQARKDNAISAEAEAKALKEVAANEITESAGSEASTSANIQEAETHVAAALAKHQEAQANLEAAQTEYALLTANGLADKISEEEAEAILKVQRAKLQEEITTKALIEAENELAAAKGKTTVASGAESGALKTETSRVMTLGQALKKAASKAWAFIAANAEIILVALAVAAALAVVGAAIYAIYTSTPGYTRAKEIEELENATQNLQDRIEETTNAVNDLSSTWDEIGNKTDELDGLIENSELWNQKILEINDSVLKLISLFPSLAKGLEISDKGVLSINSEIYSAFLKNKQEQLKNQQILATFTQSELQYKQLEQGAITRLYDNLYDKGTVSNYFSVSSLEDEIGQKYVDYLIDKGDTSVSQSDLYVGNSRKFVQKALTDTEYIQQIDEEEKKRISALATYNKEIGAASQSYNSTLTGGLASTLIDHGYDDELASAVATTFINQQKNNSLNEDFIDSVYRDIIRDSSTGDTYQLRPNLIKALSGKLASDAQVGTNADLERIANYAKEQGIDITFDRATNKLTMPDGTQYDVDMFGDVKDDKIGGSKALSIIGEALASQRINSKLLDPDIINTISNNENLARLINGDIGLEKNEIDELRKLDNKTKAKIVGLTDDVEQGAKKFNELYINTLNAKIEQTNQEVVAKYSSIINDKNLSRTTLKGVKEIEKTSAQFGEASQALASTYLILSNDLIEDTIQNVAKDGSNIQSKTSDTSKFDLNGHKKLKVSGKRMREAGWNEFSDDYATIYSSSFTYQDKEGNLKEILMTPISNDGTNILSPAELEDKFNKFQNALLLDDIENEAKALDYLNNKLENSSQYIIAYGDNLGHLGELLHLQNESYENYNPSEEFKNYVLDLSEAGGAIEQAAQIKSDLNSANKDIKTFARLTKDIFDQNGTINAEAQFNQFMDEAYNTEDFQKALDKAKVNGEITANSINELSNEFPQLNQMLKNGEINSGGLARVLDELGNKELDVKDITNELIVAFSKFESLASAEADTIKRFNGENIRESSIDAVSKNVNEYYENVKAIAERGAWGDNQLYDYMDALLGTNEFGESRWEQYLEEHNHNIEKAYNQAKKDLKFEGSGTSVIFNQLVNNQKNLSKGYEKLYTVSNGKINFDFSKVFEHGVSTTEAIKEAMGVSLEQAEMIAAYCKNMSATFGTAATYVDAYAGVASFLEGRTFINSEGEAYTVVNKDELNMLADEINFEGDIEEFKKYLNGLYNFGDDSSTSFMDLSEFNINSNGEDAQNLKKFLITKSQVSSGTKAQKQFTWKQNTGYGTWQWTDDQNQIHAEKTTWDEYKNAIKPASPYYNTGVTFLDVLGGGKRNHWTEEKEIKTSSKRPENADKLEDFKETTVQVDAEITNEEIEDFQQKLIDGVATVQEQLNDGWELDSLQQQIANAISMGISDADIATMVQAEYSNLKNLKPIDVQNLIDMGALTGTIAQYTEDGTATGAINGWSVAKGVVATVQAQLAAAEGLQEANAHVQALSALMGVKISLQYDIPIVDPTTGELKGKQAFDGGITVTGVSGGAGSAFSGAASYSKTKEGYKTNGSVTLNTESEQYKKAMESYQNGMGKLAQIGDDIGASNGGSGGGGGGGGGGSDKDEGDDKLERMKEALKQGGILTTPAQLAIIKKQMDLLRKQHRLQMQGKTAEEAKLEVYKQQEEALKKLNDKWQDGDLTITDIKDTIKELDLWGTNGGGIKGFFESLKGTPEEMEEMRKNFFWPSDEYYEYASEYDKLGDERDQIFSDWIDQGVDWTNTMIDGFGQVAQSILQMMEAVAQSMVDGFNSFLKWLNIRIDDEHDIEQLDESLKNRKELLDWEYEKLTQRDFNYQTGKNSKAQEFIFDNLDISAKNILTRLQNQRQLYANSFRQLEDLGTNINSDIESSLENLYDALYGVEGVFTKFNNKVQYLEQRFSKTMNLNLSSLRNLQLDWGKYGEMIDEALDPLKFFDGTLVEKIFKKSFEKLAGLQITEYRVGDIGESLLQKVASVFNSLSPKFDADYQIVNKSELVDALQQKLETIITSGTITEQFVSGYLEYLAEIESQMEDEVSNIRNAETEILSLYDEMTEILEKGKDEYNELEQAIYDAIVSEKETIKAELEELNDNISNADSEWINILKNNLEEIRNSRENDKTEQDLRDKQARLAYLRQDTSDANQAEILKLEKELKENQQSYTDKLIDQKISELERQNDEAATQRQVQIDLLEAEIANTEGIWKKTHELLDAISGEGSWDEILNGEIRQSAYNNIIDQLKKTSDYNDKSAHLQEEAIQEWGNLIRNAAVYGATQKGEFREQYNNLKLLKEIIDSDTKLPIDHSPNQGWHDYVAFSNLESAVSDNTDAIKNAVSVINRLVDSKTLSFEETGSIFKKATEIGGTVQALSGFEDALKNAANDIASGLPGILTQITTGVGNVAKGILKGTGAVMDTMAGAMTLDLAIGDVGEAGSALLEGMSNFVAAGFDGASLMCDIIGDTSPGITDMGVAAGTIISNWINNAFEDVTETLIDNAETILDEVFGPEINGVRTHGGAYLQVGNWLQRTAERLPDSIGNNSIGFMEALNNIYTDIGNQFDSLDLDDIEGFNKQYARFLTLQKLLEKINNNEGSVGMETTASIEKLSHWSGEIGSIFEEISPKEKTRIANALNAALYEVVKDESLITGASKLTIWDSTLKLKESDLNYYNDIYKEFVDEVEYSVDQIDAAIVALNNMFYDPLTDTYSSNSVELLIKKLQDLVPERAEQAVQIEKNIWTVFTEGIKDAWGEFGATIKSAFAGSVDGIKVILEEIKGLIAGIVGAGHARGGSIYRRLYSLTGEEGAELVQHDDGTATLVGMNGPEMADLRRGDKVYTAEQTKKILASKQSMNFKRFAEGTVGTLMDRELPLLMPTKALAMGYGNGFNASQTNRQNTFNLNLNLEGLTVDSVDRVNEVASMVWDKLNTTITGAMWPYNRL